LSLVTGTGSNTQGKGESRGEHGDGREPCPPGMGSILMKGKTRAPGERSEREGKRIQLLKGGDGGGFWGRGKRW